MLRACIRVLRPGGVLALTTIELGLDLTRAQRRRVAPSAPRAVGSRRPYADLMATAGFADVGQRDVTEEYLATTRSWLEHSQPNRERLYEVDGREAVDERLQGWRDAAAAVERGYLRRTIYWGQRR